MMKHRQEALRQLDGIVEGMLSRQITEKDDPRYGGF